MAEQMVTVTLDKARLYRLEGDKDATSFGPGRVKIPLQFALNLGLFEKQVLEDGKVWYQPTNLTPTTSPSSSVLREPVLLGKEPVPGEEGDQESPPTLSTTTITAPPSIASTFGWVAAAALNKAGYTELEQLRDLTQEQLEEVSGIGQVTAGKILSFFKEG